MRPATADYLRYVDRAEAQRISGWPVAAGGWWFASSGWVQPPSLCAANLAAAGITVRGKIAVERIEKEGEHWRLLDASGQTIEKTRTLILANGVGIRHFAQAASVPVRSARGQVSHLPATDGSAPNVVVCRLGYISPCVDGIRSVGASFLVDDEDDSSLRAQEHEDNLARLDFILPGYRSTLGNIDADGRVGFRPISPDRLPVVGALADASVCPPDTQLSAVPRQAGLFAVSGFGARGLVWSAIVAEALASELDGDPLPLERDLHQSIDPARFTLRRARGPESDAG